MKLGSDQVEKVAKLAKLKVSSVDLNRYSDQLSKILDYIEQLNEVDTKNAEPLFNISGEDTVERGDEVEESLTQNQALSNASNKTVDFFTTKGVFTDD